jgi:gas vesicle protein
MRKVLVMVAAGMMIGAIAASYARLPAAPAKTDAEKAAEAEKASAAKTKEAAELAKAQDKAVANYKKNKGVSMEATKK